MESNALEPVWRALADPTRREILDLLREGPKTTGDLAGRFEMSRFGVMKHLKLLEEAELVLVRRRGRERWNHLNAVPIQRIHERFVQPFAAESAQSLLNLERWIAAESTTRGGSAAPEPERGIIMKSFEINQEITINRPRADVWKALTTDIDKWWAFRVGAEGGALTLEPTLGGAFGERWGDGEGALWGTVTFVKRGEKLRLEGGLGMDGPGTNKYIYELEDKDGGTLLKLTHYAHGVKDDDVHANYTRGWSHLLSTCLPAWLDDGKAYSELPPFDPTAA